MLSSSFLRTFCEIDLFVVLLACVDVLCVCLYCSFSVFCCVCCVCLVCLFDVVFLSYLIYCVVSLFVPLCCLFFRSVVGLKMGWLAGWLN